jgi:multicomponent K+:H+ antiporter subunit D
VLAPLTQGRHRLKFALAYCSVLALLANALALVALADGSWPDGIGVYLAANWAAPFGIALVADRLAAGMLVLTAVLALAALHYAQPRWSRIGVHFHPLFQFLLMGINGAFLTHDLFNLFVFFEVMLAASYGLVLHGYNVERLRASLQYIAVNLVAALFFLVGTALVYATTGTLNMADMAGRIGRHGRGRGWRRPGPAENRRGRAGAGLPGQGGHVAAGLLAAHHLCGRLAAGGGHAGADDQGGRLRDPAPLAAGVFRRRGEAAHYGYDALLWGGMATIVFGAAGMLATDTAGRLAGYAAIVSSGTLLCVIGYGQASLVAAGLYYFIASTIAIAAFVLLIELVDRIRTPGAAILALTAEAYAVEDMPAEPKGRACPPRWPSCRWPSRPAR